MKAEAIVYVSNTGFTKRYAGLLSEATGLPSYALKDAAGALRKGAVIIYMGWMLAGSVKGYKKAAKRYTVKALAGVGMGSPTAPAVEALIKKYSVGGMPVFYLQGGYDKTKLRGIYKVMMGNMEKMIVDGTAKKEQPSEEELLMAEVVQKGGDFVKAENLSPIITWIQ